MADVLLETGDALLQENGGVVKQEITLDVCDAFISALLPQVQTFQETYILSHPYYFQGLKTHTDIPTVEMPCDNLDVAPSSKTTTWRDTGLITKNLPFSVTIDEYLAPGNNKGWQMTFTASINGQKMRKTIGYGVEAAYRTTNGWIP